MESGRLGQVFLKNPDNSFRHDFQGTNSEEVLEFGDKSTVSRGEISITPYTYGNGLSHVTGNTSPGDLIKLE